MKNNNLLITVAIALIAIAGIGWFVTSQAESTTVTQQDQVITTPLVQKDRTNIQTTADERATDYRGNHHDRSGDHCYNQSVD